MTLPTPLIDAIGVAVERRRGTLRDALDLADVWERLAADASGRVARLRFEAQHPRCVCGVGGEPGSHGRCGRCFGFARSFDAIKDRVFRSGKGLQARPDALDAQEAVVEPTQRPSGNGDDGGDDERRDVGLRPHSVAASVSAASVNGDGGTPPPIAGDESEALPDGEQDPLAARAPDGEPKPAPVAPAPAPFDHAEGDGQADAGDDESQRLERLRRELFGGASQ